MLDAACIIIDKDHSFCITKILQGDPGLLDLLCRTVGGSAVAQTKGKPSWCSSHKCGESILP